MPNQQVSLSGTRIALAFHEAIALTAAWSAGPSWKPQPWMQAYSVPALLTPSRRTGWPTPLTSWLPATWRPMSEVPAADADCAMLNGLKFVTVIITASIAATSRPLHQPYAWLAFVGELRGVM